MTYPAIDTDIAEFGTGTKTTVFSDGTPTDVQEFSGLVRRTFGEHRPETTFSYYTKGQWRPPMGWSHSGYYVTNTPSAPFTYTDLPYRIGTASFADGAGWNASSYGLPDFPMKLERSAVNKALLKLKGNAPNLSVMFAEREETGRLAIDASQRIVNQIGGFLQRWSNRKRGGFSKRSLMKLTAKKIKRIPRFRNTKGLLNDFLQVQYGVRPLMQDVHNSVTALHEKERDDDAYRATVKSSGHEERKFVWKKSSDFTGDVYMPVAIELEHHVYVRLDYNLENPLNATLANLGISNPLLLVWERIPFSFVADWFIPVGSFLSAFDATLGWAFKGGSASFISRVKGACDHVVAKSSNKNYEVKASYGTYREYRYDYKRVVYNQSPLPRIPRFKNPFSGEHIANAIALVFARIQQ